MDSDKGYITVGTEVVVVLPDPKRGAEKVRRAIVREALLESSGLVLIVDVESVKKPGSFYRDAIDPTQVVGLYEDASSLDKVKQARSLAQAQADLKTNGTGPVGATALSAFQSYVGQAFYK